MKMLLRKTSLLLLLTACLLIALHQTASAQGIVTGTITGTITDASGAVVRDAPVVATNTETGIKIAGKTDNSGGINLKDVPIGTYTVVITVWLPEFWAHPFGPVLKNLPLLAALLLVLQLEDQ